MWNTNNLRMKHPNIHIHSCQLPITVAHTTQLPKALWYALMNKHLGLIGKCISSVPCCSPARLFYDDSLASCPSNGADSFECCLDTIVWSAPSFTIFNNTAEDSTIFCHLAAFCAFFFPIQKLWLLEAPKLLVHKNMPSKLSLHSVYINVFLLSPVGNIWRGDMVLGKVGSNVMPSSFLIYLY